jgi:H+/Cl- antiporter ClcA
MTGSSISGQYLIPAYDFDANYLLTGALLGVLSTFVLISFALINKLVAAAFQRISNPLISAPLGSALVGLIAFALFLTAASGSSQLATQLEISTTLETGFIVAILIAKMAAVALSLSRGFQGGMVFPMIFLGGKVGILVNNVFPNISLSLPCWQPCQRLS